MLKDECGMLRTDSSSAFSIQHFPVIPLRQAVGPRLLLFRRHRALDEDHQAKAFGIGLIAFAGAHFVANRFEGAPVTLFRVFVLLERIGVAGEEVIGAVEFRRREGFGGGDLLQQLAVEPSQFPFFQPRMVKNEPLVLTLDPIGAQIDQMDGLGIDPLAGSLDYDAGAPWLAWGPYLWADGTNPRSDGLTWLASDLAADGTHPSATGRQKVSNLLMDFMLASPQTQSWFAVPEPGGATAAIGLATVFFLSRRRSACHPR